MNQKMKSTHRAYTYIALLLAVLFWGLSFIATKIALQSFTPFSLIFLRFFIASIFFGLLFWRTGFQPISKKDIKSLLFLALMQPGLYFTFETIGLQHTTATKASLIIVTIPVFVLCLSAIFLKERVRFTNLLGIICSLGGVALLVFGDQRQIDINGGQIGDLMIFGAVLAASVYMIKIRQLGDTMPSHQITGLQIIFGALLFFPAFLWELPDLQLSSVSTHSLIALICLSIFATIGAFLCYNFALTKISATRASIYINGIPLVTISGGWLILGESLTVTQVFGAILIFLSVYLVSHKSRLQPDSLVVQEV